MLLKIHVHNTQRLVNEDGSRESITQLGSLECQCTNVDCLDLLFSSPGDFAFSSPGGIRDHPFVTQFQNFLEYLQLDQRSQWWVKHGVEAV
jgi:hypothetical protein